MKLTLKNRLRPLNLLLLTALAILGLALVTSGGRPLKAQSPAAGQSSAKTPREAVETWAEAVRKRDGAAQFAMFSPKLKEEKRSEFEALNWVTGVSSPWVDKFEVTSARRAGDEEWEFEVTFYLLTSTGPAGAEVTRLSVQRVADYWYIASLSEVSR